MRLLLSLVLAACLVPAAPRELPVVEEVDIQEVDIQEVVVEGLGSEEARVEVEQLDQVGSLAYSDHFSRMVCRMVRRRGKRMVRRRSRRTTSRSSTSS